MRLFFALELPPATAVAIDSWRQRHLPLAARPIPPANYHLTLAFLGELPPRDLESLCAAVDTQQAARTPPAFALTLDEVGYWPRPGILWLGPSQWPEALDRLAAGLAPLARRGRERRRYRPHLSLYRRCAEPPPAPSQPPDFELGFEHFSLFESRQGARGMHYSAIASWSLGAD
jgi:2'-5' RNA ligase